MRELNEVMAVLAQTRRRGGGFALVTGEAGIGKTRLAEEVAGRAATDGFSVWWASGFEGESGPPYWVWAQLLRAYGESREDDQLAAELGPSAGFVRALVPDLVERLAPLAMSTDAVVDERRLGGEAARLPLFEAVVSVFRRAATPRPVLLVLDDLQWADPSSLALLRFAAREVRRSPIAIVATLRDVGAAPPSERIPAALSEVARTVPLIGLDVTGVAALAEQASGEQPDASAAATLYRQTGGNPLFVIELSRLLGRGSLTAGAVALPAGARAVIDRRVGALSPSALRALAAASVIGSEFELALLAEVREAPPHELAEVLREAVAARLVAEMGSASGRYCFTHALVRDALYESLKTGERVALHRQVGDALQRQTQVSNAAEIAHHFLRAGDHPKAALYAEAAGDQALAVLAYEKAVVHFEHALLAARHRPGDADGHLELLLKLGDARLRAGDLQGARAAFDEAAAIARRRANAEGLARAALGFGAGLGGFEVGLFDEHQITLLEDALAALGDAATPLRARVLGRLSVALSLVAPDRRRRELSEEAVEMARRLPDRRALASALASHCDALGGPAHSEWRRRAAEEVVELAETERDTVTALLGRRLRLVAKLELGDIAGVDTEIEAFARKAEDLRQPLYLWYVPLWRGMRAMMQGRLDDAERYLDHALAIGKRASSVNAVILTDSQRIQLALERDQPCDAEALLRGDIEQGLSLGPTAQAALASVLARQGRRHEAGAIVDQLTMGGFDGLPAEDGQWLNGMCRLADAAVELDAGDAAALLYGRLAPYADRFVVDGIGAACLGSVHGYLARLAGMSGRDEVRAAHFEAAVAAYRRTGSTLLLAHALADNGDAEAKAIYRSLGLSGTAPSGPSAALETANVFQRDGESWRLAFAGREVRVRHSKGLRDLAVLLTVPGRAVPVGDLVALDGGRLPAGAGTGEIIDARARACLLYTSPSPRDS